MTSYVLNHPGRLTAVLGDNAATPVAATTAVVVEGQRRGEIRPDPPAEALAVIIVYAVLFSARRGAAFGQPPGAKSYGGLALEVVLRGMRPDPAPIPKGTGVSPRPLYGQR
jgi:hypothetical protein